MKRRKFIATTAQTSAGILIAGTTLQSFVKSSPFVTNDPGLMQARLPYSYDALEPAIDATTMEIHFSRHAAGYAKNTATAIANEKATGKSLRELLNNISSYSTAMRNNAGGHYNHEKFWSWMKPGGSKAPAELQLAINNAFGSMEAFQKQFADAAAKRFGSGWAWLVVNDQKKLMVVSTPNQDNPLMDIAKQKGEPILGLDVWEHAYYLKYQNKRADYISAWWSVVNWEAVGKDYQQALS